MKEDSIMTETVVENKGVAFQNKESINKSLKTPNKACTAIVAEKTNQEKSEDYVKVSKNQRTLKKLAKRAKYNHNYLLETKTIEEIRQKLIFRPPFRPDY